MNSNLSLKNNCHHYNLCIALDWDFDWDFILLLEHKARSEGLSTFIVHSKNLEETITQVEQNIVKFEYFFDRASDTTPQFLALRSLIRLQGTQVLDSLRQILWASDKATMHLEFISQGLQTPYTIILPPYKESEKVHLTIDDLAKLGRPFIIKPANTTGGGIGVVEGAETLFDVLHARQEFQEDKYLLQEKVIPFEDSGRKFWFRGFFTCGLVQCVWWNDQTKIYDLIDEGDLNYYNLFPLFDIVKKISTLCRLKFFSTEIVFNTNREFIIVDYVNESPDMRLKSKYNDGVPDQIVHKIVETLIQSIQEELNKNGNN